RFPHFLPDGRQFLFTAQGTPETQGIYLASLDTPNTTRLVESVTNGAYLSGWLVWVQTDTLRAQRLNLEQRALTGDPVVLANQVGVAPGAGKGAFSVSDGSMLAYRTGGARQHSSGTTAWVKFSVYWVHLTKANSRRPGWRQMGAVWRRFAWC